LKKNTLYNDDEPFRMRPLLVVGTLAVAVEEFERLVRTKRFLIR